MYITPNSKIYILKDVPLDPTYDHTLYWGIVDGDDENHTYSKATQANYFMSKVKYSLTAQSYQRLQKGFMNVEVLSDYLYDCNYLMFQNTNFGTKWFYAFIKSVEYVNNKVSTIEFDIDDMQTWWFDYNLETCFVEREHTEDDSLFANIISENLDIGNEYVCVGKDTFDMNDLSMCILTVKQSTQGGQAAQTRIIGNIYIGLGTSFGLHVNDTFKQAIDNFISNTYLPDEIIAMCEYPSFLEIDPSNPPSQIAQPAKVVDKLITPNVYNIDGYIPKNNKLFCYPYNFLVVSNNSGHSQEYMWENWRRANPAGDVTFKITGSVAPIPSILCYPSNYKGIEKAYDNGIVYSNFPTCAWENDTFRAWWAQNKHSFIGEITSGISKGAAMAGAGLFMSAVGAGTGSILLGIAGRRTLETGAYSMYDSIKQGLTKHEDMKNAINHEMGTLNTESLNAAVGKIQFDFYKFTIKREYAKIIDDFFTRFGYAVHENKVPNRNARPHWTYTKTVGCTITGSIPADATKKICSIYNNGITFWNNPTEVGDYSLDNTPNTP